MTSPRRAPAVSGAGPRSVRGAGSALSLRAGLFRAGLLCAVLWLAGCGSQPSADDATDGSSGAAVSSASGQGEDEVAADDAASGSSSPDSESASVAPDGTLTVESAVPPLRDSGSANPDSSDSAVSTGPNSAAPVTTTATTSAATSDAAAANTAVSDASTSSTVTTAVTVEVESTAVEVSTPAPSLAAARDLPVQAWEPFATFADVTLLHPSTRVERIGFHESNHDGARQMEPAATAVNPLTLDSRNRGNGSRTAADIVVEPGTEIRAPVTGTVIRAGGYVLYCKHNDDFVVIEPDARPGWEVKLLHISGVQVSAGDRVEAGVTVLAPTATQLPFDSQVDEFTGQPSWPHVHIELVDPSIPDRPSTGGGC